MEPTGLAFLNPLLNSRSAAGLLGRDLLKTNDVVVALTVTWLHVFLREAKLLPQLSGENLGVAHPMRYVVAIESRRKLLKPYAGFSYEFPAGSNLTKVFRITTKPSSIF
jgi:hypothetical protein